MKIRGRIDEAAGVTRDALIKWLDAVGTNIVLVHHILPQRTLPMPNLPDLPPMSIPDTTNPHYHFYLESIYKSIPSLRYQMKKAFPNLAKTDHSLKACSDDKVDEYLQYLFNTKNGNVATLVKAFKDITSLKERAEEISIDYAQRHTKDKPKTTGFDLSMELVEMMKTLGYDEMTSTRILCEQAVLLHNQHKVSYTIFSLERVVTTALGHLQPGRVAEAVSNTLQSKLERNFVRN